MKALLIIATAIAMSSLSQAAESTAPAANPVQPVAASTAPMKTHGKFAGVSKEIITKCKAEHKGDRKAYVACLKATN